MTKTEYGESVIKSLKMSMNHFFKHTFLKLFLEKELKIHIIFNTDLHLSHRHTHTSDFYRTITKTQLKNFIDYRGKENLFYS